MLSFRIHINILIVATMVSILMVEETKSEKCTCSEDISAIFEDLKDLKEKRVSDNEQLQIWANHRDFVKDFKVKWDAGIGNFVETLMQQNTPENANSPDSESTDTSDKRVVSNVILKPHKEDNELAKNVVYLLAKLEKVEKRTADLEEKLRNEQRDRRELEKEVKETQSSLEKSEKESMEVKEELKNEKTARIHLEKEMKESLSSLGDQLQNFTVSLKDVIKNVQKVISSTETMNRTIYEDHLRKIYNKVDREVYQNKNRKSDERIVRVEREINEGCNSRNFLKLAEDIKNVEENIQILNASIGEDIVPRLTKLHSETVRRVAFEVLEDKLTYVLYKTGLFKREFFDVWSGSRDLRIKELQDLIPRINIEPSNLNDSERSSESGPVRQLIVSPGENFTLHCWYPENIWGYPVWNIRYFKPETVTRKLSYQTGKNKISLTVIAAEEDDTGLYSCITPFGISRGIYVSDKKVEHGVLLFANRDDLRKIDLETSECSLVTSGLTNAVTIEYDYESNLVVWSDNYEYGIYSAKIGDQVSNATVIDIKASPSGIAVDWIHNNIYWTDAYKSTISVASIDGKLRKLLIETYLRQPRDIVVNPLEGWIFWLDRGDSPKIERAGMDGTYRSTIVTKDMERPRGLAIDLVSKRLFWADAILHTLCSSDYDGSNVNVILLSATELVSPLALDVFEDWLYWTEEDSIYKADKFSGKNVQTVPCGQISPKGLRIYHRYKQPEGTNYCGETNSNCSHMCLPAPQVTAGSAKYACTCPDGMSLWYSGENINCYRRD